VWPAAGFGVVWNGYGLTQFAGSFSQTRETLMAVGMSSVQADIYLALPAWISVAFGIGVIGGLLGAIALLLRRNAALIAFSASLMGYTMLFAGDVYYGVFAAIPSKLAILAVVVLVAIALLWVSWQARRNGLLR